MDWLQAVDWVNVGFRFWAFFASGVAIYQWAKLRSDKKSHQKAQFTIAGINSLALQKQQTWNQQINLLPQPQHQADIEIARPYIRARDDFSELAVLATALENTVDPNSSAIKKLLQKAINIVKQNNELQNEGLKNPYIQPKLDKPILTGETTQAESGETTQPESGEIAQAESQN